MSSFIRLLIGPWRGLPTVPTAAVGDKPPASDKQSSPEGQGPAGKEPNSEKKDDAEEQPQISGKAEKLQTDTIEAPQIKARPETSW